MTLTSDLLSSDDKPFLLQVDDPTPEQASATTNADPEPDRTATVVDALTDQELDEREMALGDNQLAFENTSVSTSVIAMTSRRAIFAATSMGAKSGMTLSHSSGKRILIRRTTAGHAELMIGFLSAFSRIS